MAKASFTTSSWRWSTHFAEGGASERDVRDEKGGRPIRGTAEDSGIARNTFHHPSQIENSSCSSSAPTGGSRFCTPTEPSVPSKGGGLGSQGTPSPTPIGLQDLLDEAIPLMAEDLQAARARLGITLEVAADRAQMDPAVYLALEEGSVFSNIENVGLMMSAAKGLGLKEVRFSYVEEVQQQYMKVDLSVEGPLTIFLDTLRYDVRELKEQSLFVNPYQVLDLAERIGFYEIFESRQPADKQLIELWIAAVFTMCLDRSRDYYAGLIKDDAPDVEVLEIDGSTGSMKWIRLEITQHGRYSKGLVDVVGKKLRKKYEKGTILVVLVEQAENILINKLDDFIRANNPFNQEIFVIGGSETPGSFKVVPWGEVSNPTPSETAWLEIIVDAKNASRGYRGYEGVVVWATRELVPSSASGVCEGTGPASPDVTTAGAGTSLTAHPHLENGTAYRQVRTPRPDWNFASLGELKSHHPLEGL